MSDTIIRLSFAMLCMAYWGIMGYCLWQGARISNALVYEQELKRHWKEHAEWAGTTLWPFYDGEGVY